MAKNKKASNILVYALMGLLIAGLGGFGITNFSGAATAVATVGDEDISVEQYFRSMSNAVQSQQAAGATDLSLAAMEAQGILQAVRAQLVTAAAQNGETARLGLSVGDERVAEVVTQTTAFQGVTGEFDRESYEFALERSGWSVNEFEETVRNETARNILRASIQEGIPPSETGLNLLTDWFGERRSISWVSFDAAEVADEIPAPTDSEMNEFLAENAAAFTLPEMKRIAYAYLTPEMLAAEMPADEAALRALYAERMDSYVVPERRLVERLVFGSPEEAAAARAALDSGEADFPALVAARDLTLQDVDLGDVDQEALGQAGEAVFGLDAPGVVGPYPTDLGPALFRMNAILSASETSFEEARAELQSELGAAEATAALADMIDELDDRLAGGATLEDLAAEAAMELTTVDYWAGTADEIALDSEFRAVADVLTDKDFPEIITLDSGGLVAMRLEEILAPRLQSIDEIRPDLEAAWTTSKALEQVSAAAETARADLESGTAIADLGLTVDSVELSTRIALSQTGLDAIAVAAFNTDEGAAVLIPQPDAVLLARVDAVAPPDPDDPLIAQFGAALRQEQDLSLADDVYRYYLQALTDAAGVTFNDSVINSVHTQLFR